MPQNIVEKEHIADLMQQGINLMRRYHLTEAKAVFMRIVDINPDKLDALYHLSSISGMLGDVDMANEYCHKVIALNPDFAMAHYNLGHVYATQGKPDEAEASYREVLRLDPRNVLAHCSIGNLLLQIDRTDEAAAHYQKALQLNRFHADVHIGLGNIFFSYECDSEALACYQEALRLNPELSVVHNNLGNVYTRQGNLDKALSSYSEALRIAPGNLKTYSDYIYAMAYHEDYDAASVFAEHVHWGEKQERNVSTIPSHTNTPDPNKRLRVGYVSGDFRNHPVGIFIEPVFSHHDQTHFEIYCYSNNARTDDLTERLRQHVDHWSTVVHQTDDNLAQQIRDDGIDILIDLAGHTAKNRLSMFAIKPAPIQITWMSYIASTGLKAIDYIIGNHFVIPAEDERFYTEQVVRLPHHFLCFTPPRAPISVSPLPALSCGQITFGCFNNTAKITPSVVATWSRLLLNLPNARLFLKSAGFGTDEIRQQYQQLFAHHGIQGERLYFAGPSPREEYLAAYNEVDIGLDPFPYNGGTTTVEALWMGIPIITLRGDRFAGRMGQSIMMNIGLGEFVAENIDQYIEKTIALASDLPRLAALRAGLRQRLLNSPLCDGQGFTLDLETAYRRMWHSWCHSKKVMT